MTSQAPDALPNPPTPSERPMTAHALIQNAGLLWAEATRAPFLEALAAGRLPVQAFRRWLAQDYLFAKDLMAFQSIPLAKAPRDCHKALVGGLAALDKELEWFESHAGRLHVDLDIPPHPTCRRYMDFLLRSAHTEVYPVLIAMLFGVEASYLAAWTAFAPAGLYAEFFARWSSAEFRRTWRNSAGLLSAILTKRRRDISTKSSRMSGNSGRCPGRLECSTTCCGAPILTWRGRASRIRSYRLSAMARLTRICSAALWRRTRCSCARFRKRMRWPWRGARTAKRSPYSATSLPA